MKNKIYLASITLCFIVFSYSLVSCYQPKVIKFAENVRNEGIDVSNDIYWWIGSDESTVDDAEKNSFNFRKLEKIEPFNLKKLISDKDEAYIWLRINFIIPENLKNKSLGFVISYLHFADKVWINGTYAGGYGRFPPDMLSAQHESHFYSMPKDVLKQNEKNTIYIKVYGCGNAEISGDIFIAEYDAAKQNSENMNFSFSKIYMFFEGGMFCTVFLFLLLFLSRKKEKAYRDFSLLNLFSMGYLTTYFAPNVPWYTSLGIPFLFFYKFVNCICPCFIAYFVGSFVLNFLELKKTKKYDIAQKIFLFLPLLIIIFIPSYLFLLKSLYVIFLLIVAQFLLSACKFIFCLVSKKQRKKVIQLVLCFLPVTISIIADVILRVGFKKTMIPYYTVFGWQITIVSFVFLLSVRYSNVFNRNEYLNAELEHEVALKTRDLVEANENLEKQMNKSEADLDMASIIQQKFFPIPVKEFKGWKIAVCYEPLSKVSGDFYDYYFDDENLKGISLFDVSGHGIAASLITMLAKNIVYRCFNDGLSKKVNISKVLENINEAIIKEKGDIENYLTGLLFRFSSFNDEGICTVEMANAGHPYPFLYTDADNSISVIKPDVSQKQYGAIGIKGISVCFSALSFSMAEGDILVCFTDGLIETANEKYEQFGRERVSKIICENHHKEPDELLKILVKNLNDFTGERPRDDDVTIVVMKRNNPENYVEQTEAEELEVLEDVEELEEL